MKLLFEEAARICFKPSDNRIKKLEAWVARANSARETNNLEAYPNQYDKAEELITFYTFAPLVLSLNKVGLVNRILGLAGISAYEENVSSVGLERQYRAPEEYLLWLKDNVKTHPIRYIRKIAERHEPKKPLESKTHVDAFIETDKLLILFEVKFTSDIAYSTTFNPARNQLARLIDVGLEWNKHNGKEVLVILSSPHSLYENKSRFYCCKVHEYSDPLVIQKDLPWRTVTEIRDNILAAKWIALEKLIGLLYENFVHPDKEQAIAFFKERNLA